MATTILQWHWVYHSSLRLKALTKSWLTMLTAPIHAQIHAEIERYEHTHIYIYNIHIILYTVCDINDMILVYDTLYSHIAFIIHSHTLNTYITYMRLYIHFIIGPLYRYITLQTLHYIALHCITLHYTTIHYTTVHYIALHRFFVSINIIAYYNTTHYNITHYTLQHYIPVVPHKAVAEVSKIGNL